MSPFLRHEWLFCYPPTFSCLYALSRARDNNILRIATFAIARCLNDEKVGAVKIAGQENVSPVYPFFFCRIRNGVMRPRRIPKGNYGLVTTVGTTFYAITRLCFTAGALTHLPRADMRRVPFYYAETSFRRRHYKRQVVFSPEKHVLIIDIATHIATRKG